MNASGKIEPAESPAQAAVREAREETGLQVSAGGENGRRAHPATGRTIIYLAYAPAGHTGAVVAAPRELVEVRWVGGLRELDQLMPDLYGSAREHLAALLLRREPAHPTHTEMITAGKLEEPTC